VHCCSRIGDPCGNLKATLKIQENIPLAPLTTFQVGGPARYFVEARDETVVENAVALASERRLPLFVLGGGSNLVVSDSGWPGLVLKIAIPGVESESENGNKLYSAGAGEVWDDLVALTARENCAGLECLSGIPGSVGGTPVQNVGAYGQEVSQTITRVRALEIASGRTREISNEDCGFSYRSSLFNTTRRGEYIVLKVTYSLAAGGGPTIEYADLKKHFAAIRGDHPTLQQVRDAVRSIRQSKAMLLVSGDEDCRSAGSFFKNPIVAAAEADRLQAVAQSIAPSKPLPRYPGEHGSVKLSAAWLVEQAGFHKGYACGPVGISRKHSLAIVNRGGAKASDILALKDEVQQKVRDVWGVELHPEPVFVGFAKV
jgi:UDP-N-acetylmuramate dehydrogenase